MKKFLSLVLALVMTMSLVTISAGATEYKDLTDKDDLGIQYQEAVAVLNKIGVITGYDDGSFRPDVELTRGAAAKIIVSMLLGPEAASNLPNNAAPYPDVPANHTFAGVISYCKNSKIINGYSDGTFKPSDTLTGFAFAKMLLGALGYDNAREGLSGAGWTMNVASLGQEATLFDRIDFKGGDPVTRKDAALLALNTLKATVVEYKGGSTITVGDAQAVVNSERTYKTSNQDYARNILPQRRNIQNDLNSRADYNTVEFAEEHFVDLRLPHDKYSPTRDEYGRPSAEWSYKKLSIGTFPLEPDFEYTTQVIHAGKSIDTTTDAAKVRALGLSGYYVDDKLDKDDGSSSSLDTYTNLWINGVLQDSTGGTDARLSKTAEIADYTDNGTLVQVYVDNNGADRITDVVVIKTQMMEVRRVGSDYVSLDLYKDHSDADGKILYGYNDEPIDVAVNNVETGDDYFEFLSGLKVGDLVAVEPVAVDHNVSNKRDYDVGHAYTPETVSGALTNVETYGNVDKDRNAVNLTVGGTKYPIALWNRDLHSIDPNTVRVTTKDITLHMDKYGNAMVAKNIGATKDWMVIGNYRQSIVNGILVTFANGWDIDGKAVSLNVGAHNTNVGGTQGVWNNGLPPVGSLVYYTNSLNSNTAEWDLHWQTGQTEVDQNGDGSSVPKWTQPYDGNKYGVFDVFIGDNDDTNPYDLGVNSQRIQLYNYGNTAGTTNDLAYRDSGIKFIYITMDESGEVDSIEVKSGMQRTSNAELKGTGSRFEPYNIARAQACVALKDGKVTADSGVKAVVIKSESNAVSLRNLLYITNTDGEIRREDGTVYQKYEVAMYNESGKLETDRHIEIWSDRLNLAIGSFARYTKMDNATFENFYSLRPYGADAYETVGRSVAVARTYLDHTGNAFVGANNNLIHLDGTKYAQNVARSAVGGYKIGDYQDRDHNIINGEQKEFAYNLVDFRGAEFIDMTGKNWDIENVDDLKEAYNKSFDFYKLDEKNEHRDINVTLLFNDNPENDGFRQVYLVVVNSVSSNPHPNTSSTPSGAVLEVKDTDSGFTSAAIGDKTYNTIAELIAAAKAGDTVTFTLKPGYSISADPAAALSGYVVTIPATGKVTVTISKNADGGITDYTANGHDNSKTGVTVNSEKSGKVGTNGKFTVYFDIDRSKALKDGKQIPADGSKATITYTVYTADGVAVKTGATTNHVLGNVAAGTAITEGSGLLTPADNLTVKIDSVVWDDVNVYYVFTGKHAAAAEAAGLKDGYTTSLKSGTYANNDSATAPEMNNSLATITAELKVTLPAATQGAISGGTYAISASNYTYPDTTSASQTAGSGTAATIGAATAANKTVIAGTAPVVVTISTDNLTTYDASVEVTGIDSTLDLNDEFDTLNDNIYKVTVTPATSNVSVSTGTAAVSLNWEAVAALGNPAVKVTLVVVDDAGKEVSDVSDPVVIINNGAAGSAVVQLTGITAAGTIEVKSAETVAGPAATSVLGSQATDGEWANNDTITIVFDGNVSAGSALNATAGDGTMFAADMSGSTITVSGSQMVIKLVTASITDGDSTTDGTITLEAGEVWDVTTGARNTVNIVLHVAADGTVTL